MKLSEEVKRLIIERKKIKYDMVNVNGGFSNGVDIKPGSEPGVMDISINIYGGSQSLSHKYNVPKRIYKLQRDYAKQRSANLDVPEQISLELDVYYDNLKRAISLEFIRLLEQFDQNVNESITFAVKQINGKY